MHNFHYFKVNVMFPVIIFVFFSIAGCGQNEIDKLKKENASLKSQVMTLQVENAKLKESADYYYQTGVECLSRKQYYDATQWFAKLIEKFPNSSLSGLARQQLKKANKEIARIEANNRSIEKATKTGEEGRTQAKSNSNDRSADIISKVQNYEVPTVGTIQNGIKIYLGATSLDYDVKHLGWTVAAEGGGKGYRVQYHFTRNDKEEYAEWYYGTGTGIVDPLNKWANVFSGR